MNTRNIVIIAVVIVIAVAAWLFMSSGNGTPSLTPTPGGSTNISLSPMPTPTPTPTKTSNPTATPSPTSSGFMGPTGLQHPAICSLEGSITFSSKNISANNGAKISWQNVDIQSRQINWSISPNDSLAVGPNLFANLSVPHGSQAITVSLPDDPESKNYTLRASVTYGEYINGGVKVREAQCSGSIPVLLNY